MLPFAALLLAQAVPAPEAQSIACKATDASLPAPLMGWTAPGDELTPDKAVSLDSVDATTLTGLPAGTKPGKAATITFRIAAAGTYGIALDQPGWIDVLPGKTGGTALVSTTHGHGPECSTIKKIVRFKLDAGTYRLYLTGLAQPKAKVMLVIGE